MVRLQKRKSCPSCVLEEWFANISLEMPRWKELRQRLLSIGGDIRYGKGYF